MAAAADEDAAALASIQLARFDLTMYFPPLPAGGLAYLGEKTACCCGERGTAGCGETTSRAEELSTSLPGLLL